MLWLTQRRVPILRYRFCSFSICFLMADGAFRRISVCCHPEVRCESRNNCVRLSIVLRFSAYYYALATLLNKTSVYCRWAYSIMCVYPRPNRRYGQNCSRHLRGDLARNCGSRCSLLWARPICGVEALKCRDTGFLNGLLSRGMAHLGFQGVGLWRNG